MEEEKEEGRSKRRRKRRVRDGEWEGDRPEQGREDVGEGREDMTEAPAVDSDPRAGGRKISCRHSTISTERIRSYKLHISD